MKRKIFLILCLGLWFTSDSIAKDKLKLAVLEFAPYEFQTDGEIDGISVEIVKEVFRRMNQPIELIMLPWSRGLIYLEKGVIDGLFEILKKKERLRFADFSKEVLMEETVSLFVMDDSSITFEGDFEQVKSYNFGVRQDYSYGFKFDQAVKEKIITQVVSEVNPKRLLMLLHYNRIDILIGDKLAIPFLYRQLQNKSTILALKPIKRLDPHVQSTPSYLAFSKKSNLSHVRDLFDETLSAVKKDGTYDQIINNWEYKFQE